MIINITSFEGANVEENELGKRPGARWSRVGGAAVAQLWRDLFFGRV